MGTWRIGACVFFFLKLLNTSVVAQQEPSLDDYAMWSKELCKTILKLLFLIQIKEINHKR